MKQLNQNDEFSYRQQGQHLSDTHQWDMLLGSRGIVVIAPHPDDEILGCGALMAACAAQGLPVWVIYLTDGGASRPDLTAHERKRLVLQRQDEAIAGLKALGVPSTSALFVGAPDGQLHTSKAHAKLATYKLHDLILQGSVSSVFVTSQCDAHVDHQSAYALAVRALVSYPGIQLYTYPVSSRIDHDACPVSQSIFDIRLNTSSFVGQKRAALGCHVSQLQTQFPIQGFTLAPEIVEEMCSAPEYFQAMDIPYVS